MYKGEGIDTLRLRSSRFIDGAVVLLFTLLCVLVFAIAGVSRIGVSFLLLEGSCFCFFASYAKRCFSEYPADFNSGSFSLDNEAFSSYISVVCFSESYCLFYCFGGNYSLRMHSDKLNSSRISFSWYVAYQV